MFCSCSDESDKKSEQEICPQESTCKNGCNADGTCACPSTCKNGCNSDGSCTPVELTCPSTCKNGCNADGTCACSSTCKNGCNSDGSCKSAEVTCPSTCKNGCNADGTCACPSTCKNGCNSDGSCKSAEVTCPGSCSNGCDDAGNCIQSSSCPADFPKDGSWFDCGGCQFDSFIKCIHDDEDGDYWDMFVYKTNLVDYDAWCIADHDNKYEFDNICENKPIINTPMTLAEYCQPGNTVLCQWKDNRIQAECFTPCSAAEVGEVVLSYHDGGNSGACFLYLNDNYFAELGIYGYKCSKQNSHYVYMKDSYFNMSGEGSCAECSEKYSYEVCTKYCNYFEHCYTYSTESISTPCETACSSENSGFFVGKHEQCTNGDIKTGKELFKNATESYIQSNSRYADIVKDYTYKCNSVGEWVIYEGDTELCY